MVEQCTFFRSFFEAFEDFDDADRLALYDGLMRYVFNGSEPSFDGVKAIVWKLVKPNLDKALKRSKTNSDNASKEGKTTAKTVAKTNGKTTETNDETTEKTNPSRNGTGNRNRTGDRDLDADRCCSSEQQQRSAARRDGADAEGSAPPDAASPACPLCDSRMTYDPKLGKWRCTVCGVEAEPRWL